MPSRVQILQQVINAIINVLLIKVHPKQQNTVLISQRIRLRVSEEKLTHLLSFTKVDAADNMEKLCNSQENEM